MSRGIAGRYYCLGVADVTLPHPQYYGQWNPMEPLEPVAGASLFRIILLCGEAGLSVGCECQCKPPGTRGQSCKSYVW